MKRALALLLLVLALPVAAAEKWPDYYKKGTAAAQNNDWATVADQMQKAIAIKPAEDLAAKSRSEIFVYVPHFWLGIAKLKLGDPDGSLAEFQASQGYGVVQNTQYYSDLRAWVSRAQSARTKKASDASADSRKAADAAVEKAMSAQIDAMSSGADRLESFQAARRQLQESMNVYNSAGNDSKAYARATAGLQQAADMFASASQEAKSRKAKPKPKPAPVPPVVITDTGFTVEPVEIKPKPATQPDPAFVKAVADAKQAASELETSVRTSQQEFSSDRAFHTFAQQTIQEAESLSDRLDGAKGIDEVQKIAQAIANDRRKLDEKTAALRAVKKVEEPSVKEIAAATEKSDANREQIRQQLRRAYTAFATGNADQCERAASQLIAQRMATDEAYLLRGVARYTKGLLTNQQKLVGDAASDFSAALSLNPSAKLDQKYFSPKVVSFFNEVRRKSAN